MFVGGTRVHVYRAPWRSPAPWSRGAERAARREAPATSPPRAARSAALVALAVRAEEAHLRRHARVRRRRVRAPQVLVGAPGGDAPARGALEEAELDQVRLVDVHNGVLFLAGGRRPRGDPPPPAPELVDGRQPHPPVRLV